MPPAEPSLDNDKQLNGILSESENWDAVLGQQAGSHLDDAAEAGVFHAVWCLLLERLASVYAYQVVATLVQIRVDPARTE